MFEPVGKTKSALVRRYYAESDLGNLFADITAPALGASIGLMPSGALRKDLPAGARVIQAYVDEAPLEKDKIYQVATVEILAQSGDAYVQFRSVNTVEFSDLTFAQALEDYFSEAPLVRRPHSGRLIPQ